MVNTVTCGIYGGHAHHAMVQGIGSIDSYTKLMLHADGSDGGNTFIDEIEKTPV